MTIWRITIGVIVALLIAVGGWAMQRVATMPERHPTREEFREVQTTIRTNQNKLETKIDKIIDHLIGG